MRDLLVRYLLGELRADERQRLEDELRQSSELRRELAYLRECLPETHDGRGPAARPPTGLAERTVERISDWEEGAESTEQGDSSLPAPCSLHPATSSTPYWSFVDLTVAGGVLLAVSMLFLPALRQSRDASRRTVCADNLSQIHGMLAVYSENHGRKFPVIQLNDNAGRFAVMLVNDGVACPIKLGRLVVCPSSELAEDIAEGCVDIRIPTAAELQAAPDRQLAELRRLMGGSYAYRIGYFDGERYRYLNDMGCRFTPIMADQPSIPGGFDRACRQKIADVKSTNHGCGLNVLYQDGSVRYLKSCRLPNRDDHVFLNDDGRLAAGCNRLDTVLVPSEATPLAGLQDAAVKLIAPAP